MSVERSLMERFQSYLPNESDIPVVLEIVVHPGSKSVRDMKVVNGETFFHINKCDLYRVDEGIDPYFSKEDFDAFYPFMNDPIGARLRLNCPYDRIEITVPAGQIVIHKDRFTHIVRGHDIWGIGIPREYLWNPWITFHRSDYRDLDWSVANMSLQATAQSYRMSSVANGVRPGGITRQNLRASDLNTIDTIGKYLIFLMFQDEEWIKTREGKMALEKTLARIKATAPSLMKEVGAA